LSSASTLCITFIELSGALVNWIKNRGKGENREGHPKERNKRRHQQGGSRRWVGRVFRVLSTLYISNVKIIFFYTIIMAKN
jgi:hypothetical protein